MIRDNSLYAADLKELLLNGCFITFQDFTYTRQTAHLPKHYKGNKIYITCLINFIGSVCLLQVLAWSFFFILQQLHLPCKNKHIHFYIFVPGIPKNPRSWPFVRGFRIWIEEIPPYSYSESQNKWSS